MCLLKLFEHVVDCDCPELPEPFAAHHHLKCAVGHEVIQDVMQDGAVWPMEIGESCSPHHIY